jgi:hypothetical protein
MRPQITDYDRMSDELRRELADCVRNGHAIFVPSAKVVREAVQFVRPRSSSLIFIRLVSGPIPGWDGDGKLNGIGMSEQFIEHLRSLEK